jgi:2,4-dienoyl-CoA reductase-like NADH-dependent reductase (Old Yellow Enzyme family)
LLSKEKEMSRVFEESEINGIRLANRFVRSATWEGMASEEGACTQRLKDLMVELAEGGVGLIISGHTYVSREGQAGPLQLGIYSNDLIPGHKEMTDAVHERGGKIVLQLAHAGFYAAQALTGQAPLAPSLESEGLAESTKRKITSEDIRSLIRAFSEGARRAKEAGFDGVQIHSAHGYLLSQFLSPAYNQRDDNYGGPIENRARIHMEILAAVREAVGPNYPILIKINTQDFIDNGLTLEDSLQVGIMLEQRGIDAIELSGGIPSNPPNRSPCRTGIEREEDEAYFKDSARAFKKKVKVPLILVGGIRSLGVAERLLDTDTADYISMSRPLIREPGLIKRWREGDDRRAVCLSDNQCFAPARAGEGIYCVTKKKGR